MVDVKSFAAETTNHLGKIINSNMGQAFSDIENGFKDASVDKELYQRRLGSKIMSYDEAVNTLTYVNIEEGYKTINDKMYPYFYRLFDVSIQEKAQTLALLGNDAVTYGDQDSITPILNTPRYAEGVTYSEFMRNTKLDEKNGRLSTMYDTVTYSPYYNNGQLYKKSVNLYPDENDTGVHGESDYEFNKWDVDGDPNSILYKTKQLFRQRKINSLISRFGTHADEGGGTLQYNGENSDPYYGESRGRNLLTKSAEKGANTYRVNGYNNPYCRVWTHHYQYAKLANTIRPFMDEAGLPVKNSDFHKWRQFMIENANLSEGKKPWGWKNGNANWDKSVMDKDTGLLNMTPKYKDPGKSANIHTKDCMFSIENLAWKDFDPYSFERALSWEQRGPMGGRIMWFPPYGITFNENVSTEWTENKFIGRGESVYSYANTKRGGTLEFMMVVDHPSVVDYALWDADNPDKVTDTDLLRFFAGCDYDTVTNAAKPTPLTDEYFKFGGPDADNLISTSEKSSREVERTFEVKTKLYFPNNYTGLWDIQYFNSNPLGYLFSGCCSGEKYDVTNKTLTINKVYDYNADFWNALSGFIDNTGGDKDGYGYETGQGPLYSNSCSNNKIYYDKVTYINTEDGSYEKGLETFYRIDGFPVRPRETKQEINVKIGERGELIKIETSNESIEKQISFDALEKKPCNNYATNTYGQLLWKNDGRRDSKDYGLNVLHGSAQDTISSMLFFSIAALYGQNKDDKVGDKTKESIIKTFSLNPDAGFQIFGNTTTDVSGEGYKAHEDTINKFYELFTEKKDRITGITVDIFGYASGDGQTELKNVKQTNRNIYLASARAMSTKKILKELINRNDVEYKLEQKYTGKTPEGVNSVSSKYDRCAEVIMRIKYKDTEEYYTNGEGTVGTSVKEHDDFMGLIKGYEPTDKYVDTFGRTLYGDDIENDLSFNDGHEHESAYRVNEATKGMRLVYEKIEYKKDGSVGSISEMVEAERGKWMTLDKYIELCKLKNDSQRYDNGLYTRALNSHDQNAVNKIRYDQEYYFFKKLKQEDPIVFQRLVDKLRYFDPAFHTMTPEGFNARLTFLHQCTRQGDTTTASDKSSTSANNLAFGRPPFCVLRLGDFYNQMIVIKTVNIDYSVSEGITWDLNQEGIGVQPLLCKVTLGFDFIGGGDLSGPVRRLQNAMSFNYYANTSLYDNRADRPFYEWDAITGKSEFKPDKSYAHSVTKDYEDIYATDISPDEYVSGVNDFGENNQNYITKEDLDSFDKKVKDDMKKKRQKIKKENSSYNPEDDYPDELIIVDKYKNRPI